MRVDARALFIIVLLATMSGCAKQPVSPTATPDPLPTASPPPISVSALTFTPAPQAAPPDFSPILYGRKYNADTFFKVLGGVQDGMWLTSDQAAYSLASGLEYDVYTFAKQSFQVYGYKPEFSPPNHGYFIDTDVTLDEYGMVGVAHGWRVEQRDIEELSAENETYRQVILDWLKAEGVDEPEPGEVHIYRVDLEADGADEVFISATYLDGSQHTTKSGDYSILLMRKVVGNEAVTLPIVGDVYRSKAGETMFPSAYSFANFIDLNQDGVLEIVIDIQRWEADGAAVYQIKGQDIIKVF